METTTTQKPQVLSTDIYCVKSQKINSKFTLKKKLLAALFLLVGFTSFSQSGPTSPLNYVGAGQDVYAYSGETVQLYGNGAVSYLWQPSTGLSSDTVAQPLVTVTTTTTYTLSYKLANEPNTYQSTTTIHIINSPFSAASCTNWINNGDLENTGLPCPLNTWNDVPPGWLNGNAKQ